VFCFETDNITEKNDKKEFASIKNIIKENYFDDKFLKINKIVYYSSDNYSQFIKELSPISFFYNNI
jgi:hypothetical protein